jgi:FG-GAP-like repeat
LVDLDGDGKTDLLSGSWPGEIYLFRRQKDGMFADGETLKDKAGQAVNPGSASAAFAFDWDGDGKLDLIVGTVDGSVWLLRNVGDAKAPAFGEPQPLQADGKPLKVVGDAGPVVADWDGDGKPDLVVGADDGSVVWFRNTGTAKAPKLGPSQILVPKSVAAGNSRTDPGPGEWGTRVKPCVVDWNGDGKPDLLVGDMNGYFQGKPAQTAEEKAEEEKSKARLPTLRKDWATAYREFSAASDAPDPTDPAARATHERKVADLRARVTRLKDEIARAQDAEEKYKSGYMYHGYVWVFLRK